MSDIRTSKAYLVLERPSSMYRGPRIVALRANPPYLEPNQVGVRVVLRVPMDVFNKFLPEVEVAVEEANFIPPTAELEDFEAGDDE